MIFNEKKHALKLILEYEECRRTVVCNAVKIAFQSLPMAVVNLVVYLNCIHDQNPYDELESSESGEPGLTLGQQFQNSALGLSMFISIITSVETTFLTLGAVYSYFTVEEPELSRREGFFSQLDELEKNTAGMDEHTVCKVVTALSSKRRSVFKFKSNSHTSCLLRLEQKANRSVACDSNVPNSTGGADLIIHPSNTPTCAASLSLKRDGE